MSELFEFMVVIGKAVALIGGALLATFLSAILTYVLAAPFRGWGSMKKEDDPVGFALVMITGPLGGLVAFSAMMACFA